MADRNLNAALSTAAPQISMPGQVAQPDVAGQSAQLEYSTKLVSQLSQFGGVISTKKMKDAADEARTQGMLAITQGKSIQEIYSSEEADILSVFGKTATLQGAEYQHQLVVKDAFEQDLIAQVDERGGEAMSLSDYRAYANAKYAEALESIPDGAGRDILATMGAEALMKGTAYHAKAHFKYVQKENREAYTAATSSAAQAYQSAVEKGDKSLIKSTQATLYERMERPEGMTEEAHQQVIANLAMNMMNFGDMGVYKHVTDKYQFSPDQRAQLDAGWERAQQKQAEKGSIAQGNDLGKIKIAIAEGASTSAVNDLYAAYNAKYHRTPLSPEFMSSGIAQSAAKRAAGAAANAVKASNDKYTVAGNNAHLTKTEQNEAMARVMENHRNADGTFSAEAIDIWAKSGGQHLAMANQMAGDMNVMTAVVDGQVNANAVASFNNWMVLYGKNPAKALDMLPAGQRDQMQSIRMLAQHMPVEQAFVETHTIETSDKAYPVPTKKEVAAAVSTLDYGLDSLVQSITGVGDISPEGRAQVDAFMQAEITRLAPVYGMQVATEMALSNVRGQITKVHDRVMFTNGVDMDTTFYAKDGTELVDNLEKFVDNADPAAIKTQFGIMIGRSAEIIKTEVRHVAGEPMFTVWYRDPSAPGAPRPVNITPATAQSLAQYQVPEYVREKKESAHAAAAYKAMSSTREVGTTITGAVPLSQ